MSNPNRQQKPSIQRTVQDMVGNSFDNEFKVIAFENLVYNPLTNSLDRARSDLVPGQDYDYLDVQQTDADTETYIFKTGGSGGTTIRTIVINYTDSTKSEIDNATWS